jgi:hypothetical protein
MATSHRIPAVKIACAQGSELSERGTVPSRTPGKTRDNGHPFGIRRTIPLSVEDARKLVTSARGLRIRLGDIGRRSLAEGDSFQRTNGTQCEVRVLRPGSYLRLGRHAPNWRRSSTIQVRVLPSGDQCVVAFRQEGIPGPKARAERGAFFRSAMARLQELAATG